MTGVETLRVELRAPPAPLWGCDRLDLATGRSREDAEVRGQLGDLVSVILINRGPNRETGQKVAAIEHLEREIPTLRRPAVDGHWLDAAARESGQELEPGADPEHRGLR